MDISETTKKFKTEEIKSRFPNGPPISGLPPLTKNDVEIQRLLRSVLEKPEWWEKVMDPQIEGKWMIEYCKMGRASNELSKERVKIYDFAIREIKEILLPQVALPIIPSGVERTFKSYTLISQELKEALQKGLSPLEDQNDWHPDSNSQVLDLIHPSLFCGVVGITRTTLKPQNTVPWSEFIGATDGPLFVIEKEEEEVFTPVNEDEWTDELMTMKWRSEKYQWLPSEFFVDEKGEVKIESYINNLHPEKHAELYNTIGAVFQKFIPLFESVLGNIQNLHLCPNRDHVVISNGTKLKQVTNDSDDESSSSSSYDLTKDWLKDHDIVLDFEKYKSSYIQTLNEYSLKGKKLQVIVKAANTVIEPHKNYTGGSWHVEGMKHEHIVATGIYYYQNINIKNSFLDFRINVQEPCHEGQDDPSVLNVFDLGHDSDLNQYIGNVKTIEDLCLCFPNIYQHRVREFGLENPELPGHRKILVFFLIDPEHRITSTSTIPPQQFDWIKYELNKGEKEQGVLASFFPNDVISEISNKVEGPMTLEDAKKHRIDLMSERSVYTKDLSKKVFERSFSLCEH